MKGLGGSFDVEGSFQSPLVGARGSEGPHLLWGPRLGLVLALTGPEGPYAFVYCQDMWGIRI